MVRAIGTGIFETMTFANGTRGLYLENMGFRWADPSKVGMLELISTVVSAKDFLSKKKYKLLEVSNDPFYSAALHLELTYGHDKTQGYLLPSGLPKHVGDRKLIIPTDELILKTFSLENLAAKLGAFVRPVAKPAEGQT